MGVQSGFQLGFGSFFFSFFGILVYKKITYLLKLYLIWFGSVNIPSVFGLFGFITKKHKWIYYCQFYFI